MSKIYFEKTYESGVGRGWMGGGGIRGGLTKDQTFSVFFLWAPSLIELLSSLVFSNRKIFPGAVQIVQGRNILHQEKTEIPQHLSIGDGASGILKTGMAFLVLQVGVFAGVFAGVISVVISGVIAWVFAGRGGGKSVGTWPG